MKKIKIAILLRSSSLGGGERSAIVTYNYLDRNLFDPVMVMFNPPSEQFKIRLGKIIPDVVPIEKLNEYTIRKKIDILYSFVKIDEPLTREIQKHTKYAHSIVFTESYDPINDANLIISKTELLKVRLFQKKKLVNDFVLYLPIDVDNWERLAKKTKKPFCTDKKRIIIGRIGRAEPSKWEYLIIATLHYFKKKDNFKNFRFIYAGMPKLYKWYIRLFFRKQIRDGSIILLPELVKDDDLARFYKSLDVFHQTAWIGESFGCVITEAFCFDAAVVTDWKRFTPDLKKVKLRKYDTQLEVVDHNINGLYAGYPCMVFDQLKNKSRTELKKLGKNGHKKTREMYEAKKVIKNFENIIMGEILKLDKSKAKDIYPSRKEIDEFLEVYKNNFKRIDRMTEKIPRLYKISYRIKERMWRLTEYIYLIIRKLLKKTGRDIEKQR